MLTDKRISTSKTDKPFHFKFDNTLSMGYLNKTAVELQGAY